MQAHLRVDGVTTEVDTISDIFQGHPVLLREGTYDRYVLREIVPTYGLLESAGKSVIDIGANIGLFTLWAVTEGAGQILAVEPEECNFEMLRHHTRELTQVTCLRSAATLLPVETLSLYLSRTGKNPGNTSTTKFRGREEVTVSAVNFHRIISETDCSVLKMDCEGAEYDLLSEPLPNSVRQIAMEIHLSKRSWRETEAQHLIDHQFGDWDCLREPIIGAKNWTTIGVWRR